MSQININVSGKHGDDVPHAVIDTSEHIYVAEWESDSRLILRLSDDEPSPYGATLHYDTSQQRARFIVPPAGWAGEGSDPTVSLTPPVLTYTPAHVVQPTQGITIQGKDFYLLGAKRWTWAMMSGFCDLDLLLKGQDGQLHEVLNQAVSLRANGRRVFLMMENIVRLHPQDYGAGYFEHLQALSEIYASYGLYMDACVFPDAQLVMGRLPDQQRFWNQVGQTLGGKTNVFVSLGNELDHGGNYVDCSQFAPLPGLLCSAGSMTSDQPPPRPGWHWREWHGRRTYPKMHISEDMWYNGEGVDADGRRWSDPKPIVHGEPPRFTEGDSTTNEALAEDLAYGSLACGAGATFHCDGGKFSQLLGGRQASCAKVFFDALTGGL